MQLQSNDEASSVLLTTTTIEGRSAMNRSIISLFVLSIFLSSSTQGAISKIRESAVMVPQVLSAVKLFHQQDRFVVSDDDGFHEIENCWLDSDLRRLAKSPEALEKFQDVGYIEVKKYDTGQYSLRSHVRALGGGPGFGAVVYWTVKSSLYAALGTAIAAPAVGTLLATAPAIVPGAVAAGVTSVVAIGGGSGAAVVAGTAGTVATAAATGAAAGVVVGTVAPAQVVALAAAAAAAGGAAVATGTGGAALSTVAAGSMWSSAFALGALIEGISVAAGVACGMTPTP